jgi:hypothetical protein
MVWLVLLFIVLIFGVLFVGLQIFIRKQRVENFGNGSFATLPGRIKPKIGLLMSIAPDLYSYRFDWELQKDNYFLRIFIARQLWFGASNPAVVVRENPTIIAAYAADCDAVLLVRFWPETIEKLKQRGIGLHNGARLLTVNTYFYAGQECEGDEVELGERQTQLWSSFRPFIAEFFSDSVDMIENNKAQIPEALWERTKFLGLKKLEVSNLDDVRWGHPRFAAVPQSYRLAIEDAKLFGIES